ncbi:NUDIX domain-containing protein [Microbulbifer sp. CNSA002]|uniref:NUDIX domain-containing protein n=1 Tax=Microbulbifer sp. CNSA002 TaxID=3373604 RepID=UPI0039B3AA7C
MSDFKYCPACSHKLEKRLLESGYKLCCSTNTCDFVFWENPTPVAIALVEHDGKYIVTHNVEWPDWKYSLVSGFIDTNEDPKKAAMREIREELNLETTYIELITTSIYENLNQVMVGYYAKTEGEIILNEENDSYKLLSRKELASWSFGRGSTPLIKKWLARENA